MTIRTSVAGAATGSVALNQIGALILGPAWLKLPIVGTRSIYLI
jgi:hypothetical protein